MSKDQVLENKHSGKITDIEKMAEIGMLYDFYGELLPEKQREVFGLYYEDNYSLAEIGAEVGITRQGAYDFLRRGETRLNEYEAKLGLVKRFRQSEEARKAAGKAIDSVIEEYEKDEVLAEKLAAIKGMIQGLE